MRMMRNLRLLSRIPALSVPCSIHPGFATALREHALPPPPVHSTFQGLIPPAASAFEARFVETCLFVTPFEESEPQGRLLPISHRVLDSRS